MDDITAEIDPLARINDASLGRCGAGRQACNAGYSSQLWATR